VGINREQLDQIINDHFMFEAADDIDGVMGSLASEVEHEVIPSPMGALDNRDDIRRYYEMLFAAVKGESVTPLRRLYGDGFVVDETLWHGHISDGHPFLCDGKSGDVSFRLLHVFEIEDGKITRENAWCDLAAIQQQLGAS
jgi:ketosteroid isomerase-like protein